MMLASAQKIRQNLWTEIAALSLALMELLWITNWYDALTDSSAAWPLILLIFAGMLILSHILARALNQWIERLWVRQVIFSGWIFVIYLVSVALLLYPGQSLSIGKLIFGPFESIFEARAYATGFFHILFMLLLAWRGIALACSPVSLYNIQRDFQAGLLLMLIYGMIYSWWEPEQAIITLFMYIFVSLVAMGTSRVAVLSELRGGKLPQLSSAWLAGLIGSAALIVAAGIGIGWAVSGEAANWVAIAFTVVFQITIVIMLIVLSPVILLMFYLVPWFQDLLNKLMNSEGLTGLLKTLQQIMANAKDMPEWIGTAIRIGRPALLIGLLLIIVVIALVSLRWKPWKRRPANVDLNTADSMAPIGLPRLIVSNDFLRRLFKGNRLLAAARIRWVYAQLMLLAARLGMPRPEAVTPLEYLPKLLTLFPDNRADLMQLTNSYMAVRYGLLPETDAEINAVNTSWDLLRKQGRKALAVYKTMQGKN